MDCINSENHETSELEKDNSTSRENVGENPQINDVGDDDSCNTNLPDLQLTIDRKVLQPREKLKKQFECEIFESSFINITDIEEPMA